jgi:hypothetical protein
MFQSFTLYILKIFFGKLPKSWFFICLITFSYLHILWTLGGMSINFKKNNNTLIILQCCVIAIRCNETTCAMTRCMPILKLRPLISCAYIHPLCFCSKRPKKIERKKETNKRTWKKWKQPKKNKGQPNLPRCEYHIFTNWTLCLYTHSLYLTKTCFLKCEERSNLKVQFKGPICSNLFQIGLCNFGPYTFI